MTKIENRLIKSLLIMYVLILVIVGIAFQKSDYKVKNFPETLDIHFEDIEKIMISSPLHVGQYKETMKQRDIEQFTTYFDEFKYKRLLNDQTAYMPKKATIIYLYHGSDSDFIVSYENEVMVNHKVYQIIDGPIENNFLIRFYDSL